MSIIYFMNADCLIATSSLSRYVIIAVITRGCWISALPSRNLDLFIHIKNSNDNMDKFAELSLAARMVVYIEA